MDDFTYSYYSETNRLRQTSPIEEDKIYESGPVSSDNKVYRNILRGSAYVPSGSTVELKASEKINMSPDFKVHSGANFRAKIWKETDGVYQYDAIGNLIADLDEGLKIKWTPYGKVKEVQKGDSTTIHFKYDGAGNRISKTVFSSTDTLITRYIRDASGNVMATYNDSTMAGVVSTNDYYPFGLGMAGRSWNDSTYRYGFNGMEKDDDSTTMDLKSIG